MPHHRSTPHLHAFLLTTLLLALLLPIPLTAASTPRPFTPHDLWAIKRVGTPRLAPDGRRAVYTLQEWNTQKNKSSTSLWLIDLPSSTTRRLTSADATDTSPAWSPDGRYLAFISKRSSDETPSLYLLPIDGGEAEKILELPFAISQPTWTPNSRSIIASTLVIPELAHTLSKTNLAPIKTELQRRKDSKITAKTTENRQYRYFDRYLTDNLAHRLIRIDVQTREFQDLTPGFDRMFQLSGEFSFDLSPDGSTIAIDINSTPPPYRDFLNNDIYLLPTDGSGKLRNITPDNPGSDSGPRFAPDGRSLLFLRQETPYYCGESRRLWRHDLASTKNQGLSENLDLSIEEFQFQPDSKTILFTAEERGSVSLFQLHPNPHTLTRLHTTGTTTSLDLQNNTLVFINDTISRPGDLFTLALTPEPTKARQLTRLNDELLNQLDLGRVESYSFRGADNDDVHGWLIFPPAYSPTRSYPLVQILHGGPHTMIRDSWSYRWNLHCFAAPGYIVSGVNRHGSTGFGEKFAQSILNQWGDKPLEDILKSTDHLLARFPNIDPKKLAAAGASYGGFLATWILGHTDRFACIINHAGVNSSYSMYGTDVPHGFPMVMGGKAWDNVEGLQRQNPMFYAKNFKTPTLVLHGELDYRVPYYNGLELYGVLQAQGIPSRLVVYPNENHWILSAQNAIHWHWEMQHWLSRHIGGVPALQQPSFTSP